MANIISTCTWVMGGIGSPSCGKKCKWHWEIDDDGNRRRSYENHCPEHTARAEEITIRECIWFGFAGEVKADLCGMHRAEGSALRDHFRVGNEVDGGECEMCALFTNEWSRVT